MDTVTTIYMPNSLNEGFWGLDSILLQKLFYVYIYKIRHLRNYMEESEIEIHPSELVKIFPLVNSSKQLNDTKEQLVSAMKKARIDFYRGADNFPVSISIFPTVGWNPETRCFVLGIHLHLWEEVQTLYEQYPYIGHELLDMAILSSKYALKIYGYLVQFKNAKIHRRTMKLGDLRKFLTIADDTYPNFSEFNRAVLQKAVNAINEKDLPVHNVVCTFFKPGKSAALEKEIIFNFDYDGSKTTVIEEVEELFPTSSTLTQIEHSHLESLFLDKCLETKQKKNLEELLFVFRRLKGQYSIEEFQYIFQFDAKEFTKVLDYSKYYDVLEIATTGTFILKGF